MRALQVFDKLTDYGFGRNSVVEALAYLGYRWILPMKP
jgi:hypothetical protein